MTRVIAIVLALAAVFAVAHDSSDAQPQEPPPSSGAPNVPCRPPEEGTRPPVPPGPPTQTLPAQPPLDTPMARICSTPLGWCPIRPVVAPGIPCECFAPPNTRLGGVARVFLYEEPVSPYLNLHRD